MVGWRRLLCVRIALPPGRSRPAAISEVRGLIKSDLDRVKPSVELFSVWWENWRPVTFLRAVIVLGCVCDILWAGQPTQKPYAAHGVYSFRGTSTIQLSSEPHHPPLWLGILLKRFRRLRKMKLFWISAVGTALGMTLTKIPPMPDIDQISTDEVIPG